MGTALSSGNSVPLSSRASEGGGDHYRMDIMAADDAKGAVANGLKLLAPGRDSSFDYA